MFLREVCRLSAHITDRTAEKRPRVPTGNASGLYDVISRDFSAQFTFRLGNSDVPIFPWLYYLLLLGRLDIGSWDCGPSVISGVNNCVNIE
jgi:hypothetical protein